MARLRGAGAGLLLALSVGCTPDESGIPYAFDVLAEQRLRVTAEERIEVDGEPVRVERFADARLGLEPADDGPTELVLYIDRYFMGVEGGPAGSTEFAISDAGLISRGGPAGEVVMAPGEQAPSGGTIAALLERPVAGVFVDGNGVANSSPWHSYDPLLASVRLLDWILFSLPPLDAPGATGWESSRPLPTIGQYELGIELPLRYEARAGEGDVWRVRSSGLAQRGDLRIANGLSGRVRIDANGEAQLDPRGRLLRSEVELRMTFEGDGGTSVKSVHRFRIECRDCGEAPDAPVNPVGSDPDIKVQ